MLKTRPHMKFPMVGKVRTPICEVYRLQQGLLRSQTHNNAAQEFGWTGNVFYSRESMAAYFKVAR